MTFFYQYYLLPNLHFCICMHIFAFLCIILHFYAYFGCFCTIWAFKEDLTEKLMKTKDIFGPSYLHQKILMHNFAFLCLLGYFLHNLCIPFKKYISTFWLLLKGTLWDFGTLRSCRMCKKKATHMPNYCFRTTSISMLLFESILIHEMQRYQIMFSRSRDI